jgi:CubicO group peptidase (beta-lactamase class C family)
VTPDLRWQIGSVSKAFTATALLQLERAGQLSLTDPVVQHLPWAPHLRPDVTVHHLLTHTAGLPMGSEWGPDSRAETARLGSLGNLQPPGGAFHYSNCGYEAAGDIVETITGQPLDRHLEQAVLAPLGMTTARGAIRSADRGTEVLGHRPPDDDRPWRRDTDQIPDVWLPSCAADGSIAATPEDLARYARFLLNGDSTVLHPLDHERLSQRFVRDEEGHHGYGLSIIDGPAGRSIGHSGGMVGSYTDVRVDPELGIGCALVINGHGAVSRANAHLLDRLRAAVAGDNPPVYAEPDPHPEPVDEPLGAPELAPYAGLFRAHNPWLPAVRVIRRNNALALVEPVEGDVKPLVPRLEGGFHLGSVTSPELVTFDLLVEGEYLELDLSGCRYVRARRDPA